MDFKSHFDRFKKFQSFCKGNEKVVYLEFTNRIEKYGPSGLPSESVSRYLAGRPLGTAVADPELTRIIIADSYKENVVQFLLLEWNGADWQSQGAAEQKEAVLWLTGSSLVRQAA